MTPSYTLKVERAKQHIADANSLIKKRSPFRYTVETDYKAGKRSIGAKRNEAIIAELALHVGDAVHNLRTALDHRVWEIVAPHCGEDPKALRAIQFPFPSWQGGLKGTFETRQIHRAPENVWTALESLNPYPGGDDDLVLVHELDILDKHKLLIPAADYTRVSSEMVRRFLPDFPPGIDIRCSGNGRDVEWSIPIATRRDRRGGRFAKAGEQELPVPVEIVIRETPEAPLRPLMPTLYLLVVATERALGGLANL